MSIFKKVCIGLVSIFALIGVVAVGGFLAIKFGWTNTKGLVDSQSRFLQAPETPAWVSTPEWKTLAYAAASDAAAINKAASQSGVPARLIVAQLVSEQLRLFNTDREVYKQIFQPLQILGVQSQFSWGVMGIKEETAIQIEKNLKDPTSPYYLGSDFEHLLDFQLTSGVSQKQERFTTIIQTMNK